MSARELNEEVMDEAEPEDSVPLLPVTSTVTQHDFSRPVRETDYTVDMLYVKEEMDDDYYMKFSPKYKRRRVELIFSGSAFLIIDFLQIYALIFSVALRWTWPEEWSRTTRYIFFFNLDIWEFTKLQLPGVYKAASNYFIPSEQMIIDYRYYLLAWGLLTFAFILSFICIYISFNMKKRPNMLVRLAKLKMAGVIICHLFALPFGVAIARIFFCTPYVNKMDVYNGYTCWNGVHWAFICPFVAVAIMYYIVYPIWLITKVKPQLLSTTGERHEGYVRLKETEYAHSLSTLWLVNLFFLFSSFKRFWVYYHPVMHIFKGIMLIWYAALLHESLLQAGLMSVTLLVIFIVLCIKRPFRVTSFNFYIIFNFAILSILCIIGMFQNIPDILSAFLTPTYLKWELAGILGCWAFVTVIWFFYVLIRYYGLCCKKHPLWPQMTSHGLDDLSEHTRKYMQALLHGRIILEYALSISPVFSPAHELARQIQIINAYCREAELLHDPIHDALWDLLDELIEAHSKIAPLSLFAESVKSSIRETASEFMRIMPVFKKRLAQREYDFCLMSSLKRRMLLKMYIIGIFVNDRRDRNRDYQKTDVVKKLYNPKESVVLKTRDTDDDGYYEEDIEVGIGPTGPRATYTVYRPETAQTIALMSDDELAEFEQRHFPVARSESFSSLTDSIDINAMMAGVPSLQASTGSRPSSSVRVSHQALSNLGEHDMDLNSQHDPNVTPAGDLDEIGNGPEPEKEQNEEIKETEVPEAEQEEAETADKNEISEGEKLEKKSESTEKLLTSDQTDQPKKVKKKKGSKKKK
ncbi:uncharacterized protein [Ptychodera flava]|uniref:uncharacterized protein isoform X2 n=1 Tax=Ptychodera flava TaxID=63121 RepID=UPI003969BD43